MSRFWFTYLYGCTEWLSHKKDKKLLLLEQEGVKLCHLIDGSSKIGMDN